ncbi:MAG: Tol-Pal system beta propeller repeat protein TolB [Candidatus Tectomicrobia bacterium]|nr:Tol-Pal system beta propeller repeat protein TolB [Candidatus Tectomicrobia bacterium]
MRVALWILLTLLLFSDGAFAKVYIDINAPGRRRFPIAIADFINLAGSEDGQGLAQTISTVLSNDLEIAGLFNILDPRSYIEKASAGELDPTKITFRDWSVIGAEALVKGAYRTNGNKVELEARLFDVVEETMVVGKKYSGPRENLRDMVHKFANEIMVAFTGEKGIFETQLTYVSNVTGAKEIYMMDFDGYNSRRITNNRSINLSPLLSPNGQKLVFTSYKRGVPDLFLIDLKTGLEVKLSITNGIHIAGSWDPQGDWVAITASKDGNSDIYLIKPDGRSSRRLTDDWGIDVSPSFSPDGRQIVFTSNRQGTPQIYLMNADGSNVQRLTFEGEYNTSPSWSPRGDRIAFVSKIEGVFDIMTIKPDGTDLRRLTGGAGNNENPAWSPNGRYLAFTSSREGRPAIYLMNEDGLGVRRLTRGPGDYLSPKWALKSFE